eukprot:6310930-Amphidinium_carterae.3
MTKADGVRMAFSWEETSLKTKWECQSGFHSFRQLDSGCLSWMGRVKRRTEDRKAALNGASGGVWHKARAHSVFQ